MTDERPLNDVVDDPRTLELLVLAIQEAPANSVHVWRDEDGWWHAESDVEAPLPGGTYLSGALTVLIRDVLNVEVPEEAT